MDLLNQIVGTEFILLAFPVIPQLRIFLFVVLLLIYLLTLMGNVLIISIIRLHHHLHTAMYFFLSNLSFLDILFTSVISPTMPISLFAERKTISITACLGQTFFSIFLGTVQFILLAVMQGWLQGFVTITYGSSIFVYVRPQHSQSMAYEKAASLLTVVVIPLFNPFIYSLGNDRVKDVLRDAVVRLMGYSKKVSS
uniref:G-protein coupled receptors family 1 profile domain-containing protein n=1 Tax=Terrapene triunguis TaxID=2587831 RepID=A0A674JJM8_9SAUR